MGLLIQIDGQSGRPVFRQIIDQISGLVDSEALRPGERLPSTRSLAERLAVNRSTVYRAYQELWSLGYLESRPGSYSIIRKRAKKAAGRTGPRPGLIDWAGQSTPAARDLQAAFLRDQALVQRVEASGVIDFISLSPDSRFFPLDAFRKCMNEVLADQGPDLLQYGSPLGYGPLREFIAQRMRQHGVSTSPQEIMVTGGAQGALELLLRLLVRPGQAVVVEAPTYSRALDILHLSGVEILEVPLGGQGLDLDALESLLKRVSPALIYTIPNFHNPTGLTTDQAHRERLLGLCTKHRVPLLEDGFEEELKYFGRAVLPIKSMDHSGVVIYVGTFSKILFPGLRIGWIAADRECIARLAAVQRAAMISGNLLDQAALDRFCRLGHYELHLKRLHRVYRRRMQAALKTMQALLDPERVEWTRPAGGYTLWLRLKGLGLTEDEVVDRLLDQGVAVLPGSSHFFGPPAGLYLRLSIAHLDEAAIETGLRRLARALEGLSGRPGKLP